MVGVFTGICCGLAVGLGLYYGLPPRVENPPIPPVKPPGERVFDNAAVAADSGMCSTIGKDILKADGSVVDASIAAMLCVGLANSHSTGIGGGHFNVFFNAKKQKAYYINAREVAPLASSQDMYVGSGYSQTKGGRAVAVPGEIAGMWEFHQLHGKLPWKRLFEPIIKMCDEGYVIGDALARAINSSEEYILDERFNLKPIFANKDGTLKKAGDVITRPLLSKTLQEIADKGADVFYNGSLADEIVLDLQDSFGGTFITKEDLQRYRPIVQDALESKVGSLSVRSAGLPGSGAVLCLILNILDGYNMSAADMKSDKVLTYHRIIEAFRFAYAKRSALGDDRDNATITELVANMTSDWFADDIRSRINDSHTFPVEYYDPEFEVPEDHGTSHLSIVDEDGNAVAMTSTINTYFGSKVRGTRTGIIFNNEMDDFSTPGVPNSYGVPPSPTNFIKPGHNPMSSMSPTVVLKQGENGQKVVTMVAGASGGTRITTGTALVLMNSLWFGLNAGDSVEAGRVHDQLVPNRVDYDKEFDEFVVEGLRNLGHKVQLSSSSSIVQAIRVRSDGKLDAACDSGKGGYPDGY